MKRFAIISTLVFACLLQGCVAAFVAGAAAGGLIVYDRRTITTIADDHSISYSISNRIAAISRGYPESHIIVESFDHAVLLVGQVPNSDLRDQVVSMAQNTAKVRRVYNQLIIAGPSSAMTRSSDAWITTKVRTAMLTAKGLRSTEIKIVTESGTVYLMGSVNSQQADIAVNVARRIYGVERVVKLFEYY